MAYSIDMPAAARRNFLAAEALLSVRFDVAGYLYGLAAECAVKAMLIELGLRPKNPVSERRDDPFYQHFPFLLTSARDAAAGRRSATLSRILATPGFLAGWEIEMRYAGTGAVSASSVKRWAEHAKQTVGAIGT